MIHKLKLIIIFAIIGVLLLSALGLGFYGCKERPMKKVELEFWGVYDDSDVWREMFRSFNKDFPHIKIKYYKKPFDSYEKVLIDALAAGRGPDIFSLHNTWLPKHINKLSPLPEKLMTLKEYREAFVDVTLQDFVAPDGFIYAIPLAVDTLALYWNKDFFNTAGVPEPPSDWESFLDAVEKLTIRDEAGNILRAGAAIGTARNINRSTDILGLLMLQTGTKMVSEKKDKATFDKAVKAADNESYQAGQSALEFYTAFADPRKEVYTWNRNMDYSIDAFVEGELAMFLNYSYHSPTIKAKAPYLNFGLAPAPQIKEATVEVNYANYWGQAVSKFSTHQEAAWQFLVWLSQPDNLRQYLQETNKPSARRDLISEQKNSPELGVFAQQALSARSWYQVDNLAIENILADMIESVVLGQATAKEAISKAAKQVSLLMKR